MKNLNKTLLASGIALALGSVSTVWANPNNHVDDIKHGDNSQSAYATSTQGGNTSPQANEYSTAWQKDDSDHSDNSDRSDNSYSVAKDYGVSANNHGTATDNSSAHATDAAANNGSTASSNRSDNSDRSDNRYAAVKGTGAAANGGDASFSDSHDTDNSEAYVSHSDYSAAANNHSTAEVHMAIAEAKLDGYVTNNHTNFNGDGKGAFTYNGNNDASSAVTGGAGVIVFSQNTGQNAFVQQNVSTQASLTVN